MAAITDRHYLTFLQEIKQRINAARITAIMAVNRTQIRLYWDIGKTIVKRQKEYGWGKSIVERLACDLRNDYGGAVGYSPQNLWYMRQFYLEYCDRPNLQRLVGEIPWGQNILIFSKIKDSVAREFYLKSCAQFGWSRNVLMNQIKANAFSLQMARTKKHNFNRVLPAHLAEQADESIKNVYTLDFLGIKKPVLERELERRLTEKIKQFILELGTGFSFIGNQYRLVLGEN